MRVVLLGPPGAGKGTLANLMKSQFDLLHISTGDILRDEMSHGSELGQQAKKLVDNGELVPDELVTKLVVKKLSSIKSSNKGYILDGFPRTKSQAQELDKILKDLGQPLDYVIYMETTSSLIVKRITGRWIAPNSGMVYHVTNRPPKVPGICDVSGEKLVQRPDDTEEKVSTRMHVYMESTLPIVEYYKAQGSLLKINGDDESEDLLEELKQIFNRSSDFSARLKDQGGTEPRV